MLDRHVTAFHQMSEELISQAQQATTFAQQYRQFAVGCALLAWSETNGYKIFLGTNIKLLRDGPKVCAEQVALGSAFANGFLFVVGLCVASDLVQPDDTSKIETITLHPCWNCRSVLSTSPSVASDTFVLTVLNHRGPREIHTVDEILRIHSHPRLQPAGLMN